MKIFNLVVYLFCGINLMGQSNLLSLDQAIMEGVQNNLGIKMIKQDEEIAEINNHWVNAGAYPEIIASMNPSISSNNLDQKLSNGTNIHSNNVLFKNSNADLKLNWNVFNGFKVFATKEKLKQLQDIGSLNVKQSINELIYNIILTYTDILRLQEQIGVVKEQINIADIRLGIQQKKFDLGTTGKPELIAAQIDHNELLNLQLNLTRDQQNKKSLLEHLMGRTEEDKRQIQDSIQLIPLAPLNDYLIQLSNQSPELLMAYKDLEITKLNKKEINALKYPNVNLIAAYNFNRSQNEAGFSLLNQSYGPQGLINISIPIYNGGYIRRQSRVADLQISKKEISLEELLDNSRMILRQNYQSYLSLIEQIEITKKNLALAQENLNIAVQKLQFQSIGIVEFRQIQFDVIEINTKLYDLKYEAKRLASNIYLITGSF